MTLFDRSTADFTPKDGLNVIESSEVAELLPEDAKIYLDEALDGIYTAGHKVGTTLH